MIKWFKSNWRFTQVLMGIILLALCVLIIVVSANGRPGDRDATAVIFIAPIALVLIFSKERFIH